MMKQRGRKERPGVQEIDLPRKPYGAGKCDKVQNWVVFWPGMEKAAPQTFVTFILTFYLTMSIITNLRGAALVTHWVTSLRGG